MTAHSRSALVGLMAVVLVALTGCTPGAGDPTPTSTLTESATSIPTASPEPDAPVAAAVVVTSRTLTVLDEAGGELLVLDYLGDGAAAAESLATALGDDPVVTTTAGVGSGCDTDQAMYDFGGVLLRDPGFVGTTAAFEVEVSGATTRAGLPIETLGGQAVGATRAGFLAAVPDAFEMFDNGGGNVTVGFDVIDPTVAEYDRTGSIAIFGEDRLAEIITPHYLFGDC